MTQMPSSTLPRLYGAKRIGQGILATSFILFFSPSCPPPSAFGQGPPPHSHNWVVDTPVTKPGVAITGYYFKPEQIIPVGGSNQGDRDKCTGTGVCSLYGYSNQDCKWTAWSDGGAGGQFGRMNASGQFETCAADLVSVYKCPLQPAVVSITLTMDDITNNPAKPGADDPPVTSDPRKITVWDFTVEGPDASWRPTGGDNGNTTTLNIEIKPETNHEGASMGCKLHVQMTSSNYPGICTNGVNTTLTASRMDYAFEPQANWAISDNGDQKNVVADLYNFVTSASLTVKSYDYGGAATVVVTATAGPLANETARDKRQPVTSATRTQCPIPVDVDGDSIADGLDSNTVKNTDENGMTGAKRDDETIYTGNTNKGDGLTDYDEYRGFVDANGSWTSTSRTDADVFIYDQNSLGTGNFSATGLTPHVYGGTDIPHVAGVINHYSPSQVVAQKRILLRDGGTSPNSPSEFGHRYPDPPGHGPPSTTTECIVYTTTINSWINDPMNGFTGDLGALETKLKTQTITHELAHSLDIRHHSPVGGTPLTCVMPYPTTTSLPVAGNHTNFCTTYPHLGTHMKLR
jgi:hypothetical protein